MQSTARSFARLEYDIPERYRNAFYLANAAFFDSANWFLHRAYEVIFPSLKNAYRRDLQHQAMADAKIHEKLENIVQTLDQCNSIIDIRFPIKRNNGRFEVIRGFRAHYGQQINNSPCLGGLRIEKNMTRDQVKALSLISTFKNHCLGTGLSGAAGGIKIDPLKYSEDELNRIMDAYITELFKKCYCNHLDVVHPDINTSGKNMKWVSETFAKCSGQSINAAATGKPYEYGGVDGYDKAAALGALKALETFINNGEVMLKTGCIKTGLKNKKFIIQGLGKMGRPLGLMLCQKGAVCVGVKEREAYLYDAKGVDLNELYKYRDEHGTIENFGLSKTEYPDSIFTEECDILVLAARHKSLVCYIARDVKARVILEASDGPVTPSAHKILTGKSKLVVPDIYACAGANLISYFEYLRNLQQMGSSTRDILRLANETHVNIFKSMTENQLEVDQGSQVKYNVFRPITSDFNKNCIDSVYDEVGQEILKNLNVLKLGLDVRTAAYAVAIKNIFKAVYNQKTLL